MPSLSIAGVRVPPGGKVQASIAFTELMDGAKVTLPIWLFHGTSEGPRVYLGAGIHGDEVASIRIVSSALSQLDPTQLSGSIVCMPVQNPLALHADHRIPVGLYIRSPLEQMPVDPWTSFPGRSEGNVAEILADRLFSLIRECDYAIDVHTPTRGGKYLPMTFLPHPRLGVAFRKAEDLAFAFGSGYIVKTEKGMYVQNGVLSVEATRAGIPAIMFEIGEGGRLEKDVVSSGVRYIFNALRFLHMVPGNLEKPRRTVIMSDLVGVRGQKAGILVTEAELGSSVKRGDHLASVYDVFGNEIERISAPADGLLVRQTTLSTIVPGERVATLGVDFVEGDR